MEVRQGVNRWPVFRSDLEDVVGIESKGLMVKCFKLLMQLAV